MNSLPLLLSELPGEATAPYLLSTLLLRYDRHLASHEQNEFTLSVPAGKTIVIIDDLHTLSIMKTNITIQLLEHSSLIYRFRIERPQGDFVLEKKLTIVLAEQGADAKVEGRVHIGDAQVVTIKTMQHHTSAHTTSTLNIRGVVHDTSRLVSENLIRIEKKADRVVACEENKNLVLSDGARVISVPKLEVEAHDVSCKHGSAISQLAPEDLFYLQSRGIQETVAREILIEAFLH